MTKKQPSIGQITSFLAVYTHGSTVSAAQVMNKSQSLISSHISRLEESLGTELFDRRNGRLHATASAQKLSSHARELLENYQMLIADGAERDRHDLLIVGAPRSLSTRLTPYVAMALMRGKRGLRISLISDTYQRIIDGVAEGRLDVGVVKLPVLDERVKIHPFCDSPTIVVMPKGHPLSKLSTVRPRDIGRQPLIRITGQRDHWEKVFVAFRDEELDPNYDIQVDGVGPTCRLVAEGAGLAILNQLMAEEFVHDMGLTMRPFHVAITHRFVWIDSPFSAKPALKSDFGAALQEYGESIGMPLTP